MSTLTGLTCQFQELSSVVMEVGTVFNNNCMPTECLLLLTAPLLRVVVVTGFRPKAAGQLDSETRTDPDLLSSLQLTDRRICVSLRQQGRCRKDCCCC